MTLRHPLLITLLLCLGLSTTTLACSQPPEAPQNQQENPNKGGWNPTDPTNPTEKDAADSDANPTDPTDPNPPDPPDDSDKPYPLLLIGLDGFHPDYFGSEYGTFPNLERLRAQGTTAKSLKPVFPTKTFVNIYSIATGLYAENHGIVGNTVYDAQRDQYLRMSDARAVAQSHWWGGEPIWVTAERQGLKTGTFFWVGSEAKINGYRPSHWVSYDSMIPYRDRIDQVVQWLTADDPVQFATLYFAGVDGAGHANGPRSAEVAGAIRNIDHALGYLIDSLDQAGIWPNINLLIVSDHGMVLLDKNKRIMLDDIISLNDAHIIEWSPVAMLTPHAGKSQKVFDQLNANNPYRDHYELYRKEDIPDDLHFKNHERIPEIILIADMPYDISRRSFDGHTKGGHGYSPEYPEMHGIFIGHGPNFKQGHTTDTLQLVDLYELMTHLLEIEAAPNDGDLSRIGPQVLNE